jgi:carbon monoxide dehydrogenase subunit G
VIVLGKVTKSIEIEVSPEKVFALLCDMEKMNEINKEIEEAEYTSKGPIGVGTTRHVVGKAGRFKAEVYTEITEFEKNKKISMRTIGASTIKANVSQSLEPTAKGTKLTFTNDYEPPYSILGKIVDKLMIHKNAEKNMERYQINMKKALEG